VGGFDSDGSTSPFLLQIGIVQVLSSVVLLQQVKSGLVFGSDFSEGNSSSGLLVNELSQSGLRLDESVGHLLLLAKSGQPDDELNGVHIGCY